MTKTPLITPLQGCKHALADLEGMMPEFEPDGERKHPAWKTIKELRKIIHHANSQATEKDDFQSEWKPDDSWANHPEYPVEQWQDAVWDSETRLGYIAWVNHQLIEQQEAELGSIDEPIVVCMESDEYGIEEFHYATPEEAAAGLERLMLKAAQGKKEDGISRKVYYKI